MSGGVAAMDRGRNRERHAKVHRFLVPFLATAFPPHLLVD